MEKPIPKKVSFVHVLQDFFKQAVSDKVLVQHSLALSVLLLYAIVTTWTQAPLSVLWIFLCAVAGGLLVEIPFAILRKRKVDAAWLYTPLLLTMLLPSTIVHPATQEFLFWIPAVGAAVGALYGKLVFGGHRKYIFNPSIVGALFLFVSFGGIVAASGNTAALLKNGTLNLTITELLVGPTAGFIGDPFRIGILVLALVLAYLKALDLRVTFSYLLSILALVFLGRYLDDTYGTFANTFADPQFTLLVGSVVFTSVFTLPDVTTTPVTGLGKILYGFVAAAITVVIRTFTGQVEGVIFAVILANALSPLLDAMATNKPIPQLIKGAKSQ